MKRNKKLCVLFIAIFALTMLFPTVLALAETTATTPTLTTYPFAKGAEGFKKSAKIRGTAPDATKDEWLASFWNLTDKDLTGATFIGVNIKNVNTHSNGFTTGYELTTGERFSTGGNGADAKPFYWVNEDGTATVNNVQYGSITIPASFSGMLLMPMSSIKYQFGGVATNNSLKSVKNVFMTTNRKYNRNISLIVGEIIIYKTATLAPDMVKAKTVFDLSKVKTVNQFNRRFEAYTSCVAEPNFDLLPSPTLPAHNLNDTGFVKGLKLGATGVTTATNSAIYADLNVLAANNKFDGDGLAIRVANITNTNWPINLNFHENTNDGNAFEIWGTAQDGEPKTNDCFKAIGVNGVEVDVDTYYASGPYIPANFNGTLFIPYANLLKQFTATPGTGGGVMSKNFSALYFAINCKYNSGAKFVIGRIGDYDATKIDTIIDFTELTDEQFAPLTKADSVEGTVLKRAGDDAEKKMTAERSLVTDVVIKDSFAHATIGDVKILDDFDAPTSLTKPEDIAAYAKANYSCWAGGYNVDTSLVKHPSNANYAYGDMLSYHLVAKEGMGGNPYGSVDVNPVSFIADWKDWSTAKGITFYIKNVNEVEMGMNVEFDEYNPKVGEVKEYWERWSIDASQKRIYLYDVNTNKEFVEVTKSVFYIPVGFEGWVRIPFTSYVNPGWTTTNGYLELAKQFSGFHITSNGGINDDLTFLMDNIGIYTNDFQVGMLFNQETTAGTIKSNLGITA